MDIINHYSAYTTARTSTVSQAGTATQKVGVMSENEFLEMIKNSKLADESSFLYNGSESRARLSDTEIAVLANKYDPNNMDQDAYDKFLDDLEGMGAISNLEKRQLGYGGWQLIAYKGTNGETIYCGSPEAGYFVPDAKEQQACFIVPWEADTDLHKWLGERTQKVLGEVAAPSTREAAEAYEKLLKNLYGIVGRMAVRRTDDEEAQRKAELVRQLADGNSDFYTRMRTMLKAQVEKSKEEQQEQDIIDALGKVLDALSGKKDVAGKKVSLNTSANELTKAVNDRIAELKRKNPNDPEIAKLENMLAQLRNAGLYTNMGILDDTQQGGDDTFETLTQLLTRRQAEEISTHPNQKEVNEPA